MKTPTRVLRKAVLALLLAAGLAGGAWGDEPPRSKTLRVDHGRPLVVVGGQTVLALEFLKQSAGEVLVPHDEPGVRHCQARYRFRLLDGATGSVTNGEGMVEESYQRDPATGIGHTLLSRVSIPAGEFYLWWSEGTAGERSWVYYRATSPVRFLQQPRQVPLAALDRTALAAYLGSRNVTEFVEAGKRVQVLGPAMFAGDLPTEGTMWGRIESARIRSGMFELSLSGLATNQHYLIESSYEANGGWNPVHTFLARTPRQVWSESVSPKVDVLFYRVRAGAY